MRFGVTVKGTVIGTSGSDQVKEHLDTVMEELLKIDAENPSVKATFSTGAVEISVVVVTATQSGPELVPEALRMGLDVIRTALLAAGGATPDWPTELLPSEWGVTLDAAVVRKTEDRLVDT